MQDRCPKCGAEKCGEACVRCGLVFEKFDPAVLEEGVAPELIALWQSVEADWDNSAVHAFFVESALAQGQAAYAAQCYRRASGRPKAEEYTEIGA